MPKVSILVPNYNSGKFAEACVRSIENQVFTDFEVIVGDSSSTDESRKVLKDYTKRDDRAQFYDIPREGIYPGWNECLRRASGEWIAVATSDDQWHPEFLQSVISAASQGDNIEHVASGLRIIDEDGRGFQGRWESLPQVGLFHKYIRNRNHSASLLSALVTAFISSPCVSVNGSIFRRTLFERLGEFPDSYGRSGDRVFYGKVFLAAKTYYLSDKLADWRRHEGQTTGNSGKFWLELSELNEWEIMLLREALKEIDVEEEWKFNALESLRLPILAQKMALAEEFSTSRKLAFLASFRDAPVTTTELLCARISGRSPMVNYRAKRLDKLLSII